MSHRAHGDIIFVPCCLFFGTVRLGEYPALLWLLLEEDT